MVDSGKNIQVVIQHHLYFNYSFCLHNLPFLERVTLVAEAMPHEDVFVEITSSLGIFKDYRYHIVGLQAEESYVITNLLLKYDLRFLRDLKEKDLDRISLSVTAAGALLYETSFDLTILPIDYFGGLGGYPQLLATYILPNHEVVYGIKSAAAKLLEQSNVAVSFEGYQSGSKDRVLQMVDAVYQAIQQLEIVYSAMPPSFETTGQRIRLADQVVASGFGNCIDVSLLFAACLEAINLNPLLIITRGHAFVGVWLEDLRMDTVVNYDQAAISKRVASGIREICLIEATEICKGSRSSLRHAMDSAERQILDVDSFLLSIEVKSARAWGIGPLALARKDDSLDGLSPEELMACDKTQQDPELQKEAIPTKQSIDISYEIGEQYESLELIDWSSLSKQKVWERKLLDLSLRNNLLNLRFTRNMLQLMDVKIDQLEDKLANNKAFTIQPNSEQPVLKRYSLYSPPLHPSEPMFTLAQEELGYNRLLTNYHQEDLDNILTHLYRNSKLAEEENGKSTLYLGLGLLKWYDHKSRAQARYAPILLVPVELSRKSVKTRYQLRSREEETMFNITLLEYLKQEYKLNLNSLENLPMDESGVDVARVFALLRKAILYLPGWDVLEQTVLGNFSFNKLILWQDISKNAEQVGRSLIVRSLINGKLDPDFDIADTEEDLEKLPASALNLPIATDHSQLDAVRAAHANKTFVLHGPPGTGKSQTITNIIANALANNKKVLFVAAKKAALDVVHNRLEKIGLGPFCLELHSNKSKKSDVIAQLQEALENPKYQSRIDFEEAAGRIDERKEALREYVDALHEEYPVGWSLYDSISYLDEHGIGAKPEWAIPLDTQGLSRGTWFSWKDWAISFASFSKRMPEWGAHPLRYVSLSEQGFSQKELLVGVINVYLEAKAELEAIDAKLLLNLPIEELRLNPADFGAMVDFLSELKAEVIPKELIMLLTSGVQHEVIEDWMAKQKQKQEHVRKIIATYSDRILEVDTAEMETIWSEAADSWFLKKWWKQRKVKKFLKRFRTSVIKHESEVWDLWKELESYRKYVGQLKASQFDGFEVAVASYKQEHFYPLEVIHIDINKYNGLVFKAESFYFHSFPEWYRGLVQTRAWQKLLGDCRAIIETFIGCVSSLRGFLSEIPTEEGLAAILGALPDLEDRIRYNHYKLKAEEIELSWFIKLLEGGLVDKQHVERELDSVIHFNFFLRALERHQVLHAFDAEVYTAQLAQYKSLHDSFVEQSKNQLILQLSNNIPNATQEAMQSSEIGILQRNIRNKGRGMSLRKLFDAIPTLLPRLKPCMLMSPISVAQYFDANPEQFDLVIFDEASQLPTSEAISALARAKQAIIVGDPKQMPPTTFFASAKVDEDNLDLEDMESILDDSLALSIPSKYLLRHYRSKHESLITFSNYNFYNNKLLTFPSSDDLAKKVTLQLVEGTYDKGSSRTNKKEAAAVVAYIAEHLRHQRDKSIGVVTFSQAQQNLVEDLLYSLFTEHPELEEAANYGQEPIFIKNLENVQGDERDFILFSIGYGPDEKGKVSMNFGPLNREGGWRRLNVAVTRARYEMKVFSTLRADQIDLNRTQAEGVKGLKSFLHFAEHGYLHRAAARQESTGQQELVDNIAASLARAGLSVKTQIGTSGYRVDIAVVDPNKPDSYILGILVDGRNYVRTQTTNDRELLIPGVLQSLGWNVFRIWTLDWMKDKAKVIEQVKERVERLIAAQSVALVDDAVAEVPMGVLYQEPSIVEVSPEEHEASKRVRYQQAHVEPAALTRNETIFFPINRPVLKAQLATTLAIEAPMSKDHLYRKVLKLWEGGRMSARFTSLFDELIAELPWVQERRQYDGLIFYYTDANIAYGIDYYRDNSIEKRNMDDIPPEEIQVALLEFMQRHLSISREELIRAMARIFDFGKRGAQIELIISQVLEGMIADGRLKEGEGRVVLG